VEVRRRAVSGMSRAGQMGLVVSCGRSMGVRGWVRGTQAARLGRRVGEEARPELPPPSQLPSSHPLPPHRQVVCCARTCAPRSPLALACSVPSRSRGRQGGPPRPRRRRSSVVGGRDGSARGPSSSSFAGRGAEVFQRVASRAVLVPWSQHARRARRSSRARVRGGSVGRSSLGGIVR
jgi:hypothetical protein